MQIGRVIVNDLEAIAALHAHFWGEISDVRAMAQTLVRLEGAPDHILLAARVDGSCVGTATGVVCHGLYGGFDSYLVIEDVVVDPDHRRAGIATALLHELERISRERGCQQMILLTESCRSDAAALYESAGFEGRWTGFKKRLGTIGDVVPSASVVKHVVVWMLLPEAAGRSAYENALEAKRRLEALNGRIPGMLHLEVGIDVGHTDASAGVVLYSVFETQAALDAYQSHPEHLEVADFVGRVRESRTAVDYLL